MENKNIRICVVDTVYSLCLYFLRFGFDSKDVLIFSAGIPKEIRNNINHVYFPEIKLVHNKKSFFTWFFKNSLNALKLFFGILELRTILFFKTKNKNVDVYGQGHLTFSYPLYEYENSYIIEDGLGNYLDLKQPTKINSSLAKVANFFGIYIFDIREGFGTHNNIKKVFLTKNNPPFEIKDKVEIINMDELWDLKTDVEKNKILEIFNLNNIAEGIEQNMVLLLTEPFAEHDLLPFDEEINIYNEFINKYPEIIIKSHPREKKNYKEIFPNTRVINVPFPVEMLKYVGIKVDKIVTICSTAALNFKDDAEIELYDKNTSSKRINNAIALLKEEL